MTKLVPVNQMGNDMVSGSGRPRKDDSELTEGSSDSRASGSNIENRGGEI